jgi:Glycosyltransferase family 9 (heptosyltransferase)
MGDVILTEPIASALAGRYDRISLYTECLRIGTYLPVYDEVLPFSHVDEVGFDECDTVLHPLYEVYPGCNHLDGFARSCGITLKRRLPALSGGSQPVRKRPYLLVAPDTSDWIREMRQWPRDRFLELADLLQQSLEIEIVFLEPSHDFDTMMALIEHCDVFLGNDSGPSIIAQCYSKPTFVIFGATSADRVLLSSMATGISSEVGCNGCKHFARHTEISCAAPMCLQSLAVTDVASVLIESAALKHRRPLSE